MVKLNMHQLLKSMTILSLLVLSMLLSSAVFAFELQDTTGNRHQLAAYKGQWVIVNYWATWCPPCLEEVPELVNLYDDRHDDGVMVIGVVFDYESVAVVEQYVDDMLMSYPIVLGNDRIAEQIGPATVLPTTYIFNPQGALIKVKRGAVSRAYLERMIAP